MKKWQKAERRMLQRAVQSWRQFVGEPEGLISHVFPQELLMGV